MTLGRASRYGTPYAVARASAPRPSNATAGAGLIILDALCPGSWGVDDAPFGKTVWAEVKGS